MTHKTLTTYFLIPIITLTFTACEQKSHKKHRSGGLSITKENQSKVVSAVFDSIDTTTPMLPKKKTIATSVSAGDTLIELPETETSKTVEPEEGTTICTDGGSVTYRSDTTTYTYDQCKEGNTTVNGTVKESIDATNGVATYTLTNYAMTVGTKSYETSSTTYTIENGTVSYTTTGKATIKEKTYEFSDYHYQLSLTGERLEISVDGSVKASDLGAKWMNISTSKTIQLNDETCPVAGEVTINGSALKVSFSDDKSIDIFLNNSLEEEYETCDQIPALSGV